MRADAETLRPCVMCAGWGSDNGGPEASFLHTFAVPSPKQKAAFLSRRSPTPASTAAPSTTATERPKLARRDFCEAPEVKPRSREAAKPRSASAVPRCHDATMPRCHDATMPLPCLELWSFALQLRGRLPVPVSAGKASLAFFFSYRFYPLTSGWQQLDTQSSACSASAAAAFCTSLRAATLRETSCNVFCVFCLFNLPAALLRPLLGMPCTLQQAGF